MDTAISSILDGICLIPDNQLLENGCKEVENNLAQATCLVFGCTVTAAACWHLNYSCFPLVFGASVMGCFCAGCQDKAIGHRAVKLGVVDQQPTLRETKKLKKEMIKFKEKMENKFKEVNENLLVTKDKLKESEEHVLKLLHDRQAAKDENAHLQQQLAELRTNNCHLFHRPINDNFQDNPPPYSESEAKL